MNCAVSLRDGPIDIAITFSLHRWPTQTKEIIYRAVRQSKDSTSLLMLAYNYDQMINEYVSPVAPYRFEK
jgi:hypothetical protein